MPVRHRRVTLLQLVAATCFMVSGGPYGLEDLVRNSGYFYALLILLIIPIIWSIPTALMVGELASAIPTEGGYYIWIRRALGPFWGFQEAWLQLIGSVFDMAIYPTLFVAYLTRLFPTIAIGYRGITIGLLVIAVSACLNLRGASAVGRASLWSGLFLIAPFAAIVVASFFYPPQAAPFVHQESNTSTLLMGILVAMWNYMGWESASTIAGEVENPQRTYPLAMGLCVLLIAFIYIVSVGAAWHAHIDPEVFSTGGWAEVGRLLCGPWLEVAIVLGGCLSVFGTFNSLLMSYTRVPYALAQDGILPKVFLMKFRSTGAPWVSILVCSIAWALSLGIGFQRLIHLDILFYGASLFLEFTALVILRIKEPHLERPFKVPGGLIGTTLLAIPPILLVIIALVESTRQQVAGTNVFSFALMLTTLGMITYFFLRGKKPA
jgi:amino acid transporter